MDHLIQPRETALPMGARLIPGRVVNHAGKMDIHVPFEDPKGILQRSELGPGSNGLRCGVGVLNSWARLARGGESE